MTSGTAPANRPAVTPRPSAPPRQRSATTARIRIAAARAMSPRSPPRVRASTARRGTGQAETTASRRRACSYAARARFSSRSMARPPEGAKPLRRPLHALAQGRLRDAYVLLVPGRLERDDVLGLELAEKGRGLAEKVPLDRLCLR